MLLLGEISMKKSHFIIVLCLLIIFYLSFIYLSKEDVDNGYAPIINVPDSVLKISVKADEKDLLQDVSAHDIENGDITSKVFIENISEFDENKERVITYAVFDNDDHISRATRKLKYTDYKAPKFNIVAPLCVEYFGNKNDYLSHINAVSTIDGDITSKVSFVYDHSEDIPSTVTYTVSDSSGTESTLKLNVFDLTSSGTIDIQLSKYLIYVPLGKKINFRDYIEKVIYMDIDSKEMMDDIKIHTEYDPNKKGTYDVVYELNASNGETQMTKLVVIVE